MKTQSKEQDAPLFQDREMLFVEKAKWQIHFIYCCNLRAAQPTESTLMYLKARRVSPPRNPAKPRPFDVVITWKGVKFRAVCDGLDEMALLPLGYAANERGRAMNRNSALRRAAA